MNEPVIVVGLEVHVQLATQSKLFCGCSTAFGAEPNTQTCPVCMGLPGTLPVLNREAVRLAVVTGLALNCRIAPYTKWDRKQYYYPDLPKGYQISQYDLPITHSGWVEFADPQGGEPRRVRILRAHLEEDAGKSLHDEAAGKSDTLIDLNRAGTPLLEIVTQPDLRGAAESKAFLTELRLLLTHLGVSDCNMQEGSLRVDANVNLHIPRGGETVATPIVEIKNLNSFRGVERAIEHEAPRQLREFEETGRRMGDAPKQTRGWDDAAGRTIAQREKEESSDYRYFPDPDLAPVTLSDAYVEECRATLGELPAALRGRLLSDYGLSAYDADVIVNQGRPMADYYLAVADASGDPKAAANWVTQELLRTMKFREMPLQEVPLPPDRLAAMIRRVAAGDLPGPRAREVFERMIDDASDADSAMAALGIEQVDDAEIMTLCRELLEANPRVVADVKTGKPQAIGSLIGQAKKRNPNVDPTRFREACLEVIATL